MADSMGGPKAINAAHHHRTMCSECGFVNILGLTTCDLCDAVMLPPNPRVKDQVLQCRPKPSTQRKLTEIMNGLHKLNSLLADLRQMSDASPDQPSLAPMSAPAKRQRKSPLPQLQPAPTSSATPQTVASQARTNGVLGSSPAGALGSNQAEVPRGLDKQILSNDVHMLHGPSPEGYTQVTYHPVHGVVRLVVEGQSGQILRRWTCPHVSREAWRSLSTPDWLAALSTFERKNATQLYREPVPPSHGVRCRGVGPHGTKSRASCSSTAAEE